MPQTGFRKTWLCMLTLLGLCTFALVCVPLFRITANVSLNYNEGWNTYRQHMAAEGSPLYAAPPTFFITNYPPLSFHLVGFLSQLTGDVTATGRTVALISLVVTCLLVTAISRHLTASWPISVYAALCFFIWLGTFTPDRLAMNDPQLLGVAFAALGLYAYVRSRGRVGWLTASALAFTAAVFIKNNLIAFPIAIGMHLILQRDWGKLLLWAGIGIGSACALLFLTLQLDGHYFFAHLLRSRWMSPGQSLYFSFQFTVRFFAPLVIGIIWLVWSERSDDRDLLLTSFMVAFIFAFLFSFGAGTVGNLFYETMIALTLAVVLALSSLERALPRARWGQSVFAMLVALPALPGIILVPQQLHRDLNYWMELPSLQHDAAQGVALLREVREPVLCEDLLLCYEAGRQMAYDAFFVRDQIMVGHIQENDILAQIQAQYYGAVEIGVFGDASQFPASRNARRERFDFLGTQRWRFSEAFMQSLLMHYRPTLQTSRFVNFTPTAKGD
jgi:Dolichyl-phosphate-mannose-protein mannosyltransferase